MFFCFLILNIRIYNMYIYIYILYTYYIYILYIYIMCIYIYVCVCVCVCLYVYTRGNAYIPLWHTHTMCTHTHACALTHMNIRINIYIAHNLTNRFKHICPNILTFIYSEFSHSFCFPGRFAYPGECRGDDRGQSPARLRTAWTTEDPGEGGAYGHSVRLEDEWSETPILNPIDPDDLYRFLILKLTAGTI